MNLNERPAAVSGREMLEPPETLLLTPEAYKATEAVEFIAEHLRNEDEYTQVSTAFLSVLNFLLIFLVHL